MSRLENEANFEISLRGTALKISIKFEVILMDIVYFSNSDQYVEPSKSASLKLKNLTFGGKISRVKELVRNYHLDLFEKHETLFKDLDDFLILRNMLAHCAIYWPDGDLKRLFIWDVVEGGSKFQYYQPKEYTRKELSLMLVTFLNSIANPLLELQKEIQERMRQSDPKLYSSLTQYLR